MNKKTIIYCRRAVDEHDKHAFKHQITNCIKLAKQKGLKVVDTVTEYGSGMKINKGLKNVLGIVGKGKIQNLITYDSERISRNNNLFFHCSKKLEKNGGKLVTVIPSFLQLINNSTK